MANIINVEKSKFIEENIQIYTSNRLGQYSKFLDKAPCFVTYFAVNEAQTTVDLGTGNIDKAFGPQSPIRYNKITFLPAYNIPELKPDITLDESEGVDISLELSDITFLPNTIKPRPYDCMLLTYPDSEELLFRVNSFRLNSIQSNDYYMADMDLKAYGKDLEKTKLAGQIVDTYQTVFENIGTQDKCFIRESDVDKINTLVRTIELMRQGYVNNFYDTATNSFLLRDNCSEYKVKCFTASGAIEQYKSEKEFAFPVSVLNEETYHWTDVEYYHDEYLYDPYLEKFIRDTQILVNDDDPNLYIPVENDILQPDFNSLYTNTLYFALEKHMTSMMALYLYCYQSPVVKVGSVYNVYSLPVNSLKLLISTFDRFLEPEKKLANRREEIANELESLKISYERNQNHYTEESFNWIIKKIGSAKLDIYSKITLVELNSFYDNFKEELENIKTIEQAAKDEYIRDMTEYLNSLDTMTYSDESIAQMHAILNKYVRIYEVAPYHVYEEAWEKFQEEIAAIPQLTEDEIIVKYRNKYRTEMNDLYGYYMTLGLTSNDISRKFTDTMIELDTCERTDEMKSLVESFVQFCESLLPEEDEEYVE